MDIDGASIFVGSELESAGPTLTVKANHCAEMLEHLKAELAPLADAWSQSQAADYYQGLQQEWNIAADGLFGPHGVLGQIAHALHINWGNYSDTEWANIKTWQH
ncbi:MAG: WXG100 family type VII secretion target [Actinoallomurus sp.]